MPIGAPSQLPEPKSGWTLAPRPMLRTSCAEAGSTGIRSTRWFQGLSFGNTGHLRAPRSGCADASATVTIVASAAPNASSRFEGIAALGPGLWQPAGVDGLEVAALHAPERVQ